MPQEIVTILQGQWFGICIGQDSTGCFILDKLLLIKIKDEFWYRERVNHAEDALRLLQAVASEFLKEINLFSGYELIVPPSAPPSVPVVCGQPQY